MGVVAVAAGLATVAADIAVCPGEGSRYGDYKCNHDPTHRVCATLLDQQGQPLDWGTKGTFWQITGQEAFQWDDQIRANHGDSWCICMWATARLISTVGCENVHLNCDATDVAYVEKSYTDGGVDLEPAKKCLEQKCPAKGLPIQRLSDAALPKLRATPATAPHPLLLAGAVLAPLAVVGAFLLRSRHQTQLQEDVE